MDDVAMLCLVIALWISTWGLLWLWIFLPSKMACHRKRSPAIWILVSLLFSPLVAITLLAVLGDSPMQAPN